MTCKDCAYAVQPTTTMRCQNHGICMMSNAVVCNEFKGKPQTNADRFRAMSDEELAEWNAERSTAPNCTGKCHKDYEVYGELRTFCHDCWLDWLKQGAEK